MITKLQAETLSLSEIHAGHCQKTIGKRGAITLHCECWRRNGETKTWKRDPERFRVPIKYGMYDFAYLTESNASHFHLPEDCHPTVIDHRSEHKKELDKLQETVQNVVNPS